MVIEQVVGDGSLAISKLFDDGKLLASGGSYSIIIGTSAILTLVWPVVSNYVWENKDYLLNILLTYIILYW